MKERQTMSQTQAPSDFPKGCTVRVVKGRKVEHGTTGDVFWSGWDKYKADSVRVGFKADGKTVWASDWMVEKVVEDLDSEPEDEPADPEPYEVAHGPRDDSESVTEELCPF